jgi:hypothetical protein
MTLVDRRTALTIFAAATLPISSSRADEAVPEYSEEEVVRILTEEGRDGPPLGTEATFGSFWFQKPEGQRPFAHSGLPAVSATSSAALFSLSLRGLLRSLLVVASVATASLPFRPLASAATLVSALSRRAR